MKLKNLAEISGVPASSIKFYLRHGLLNPGEKLNATTARYGHEHVERLELIKALRQVVGLSLEQCTRVTTAVDDTQSLTAIGLMGEVQTVIQEFLGQGPGATSATDTQDSTGENDPGAAALLSAAGIGAVAGDGASPAPAAARLTAEDIVSAMGWLGGTDESMAALDQELSRMADWGLAPHMDSALVYARAVDTVAAHQLRTSRDRKGLEEWERMTDRGASGDESVSRDQLATYVALGVYSYSRFLLKLLAVAQGAHARLGPADEDQR